SSSQSCATWSGSSAKCTGTTSADVGRAALRFRRGQRTAAETGLRHDSITHAHADDARAAAGGGLGTELPNGLDGTQPTTTRTAEQAADASGAAEQVPQGRQEDTRAGGRGGAMDGFGARRSDNPPDTAHADQSGIQARATADILGSRQELCSLPGSRQPWHDQHADSSQPGMAPTVRGRHGDDSQTYQNRAGHPSPPNSGNGQLDFADSAPVVVHRVERGAEEGPAIKQAGDRKRRA
ncbi:pksN, partial [Symbiodinium pilosum]